MRTPNANDANEDTHKTRAPQMGTPTNPQSQWIRANREGELGHPQTQRRMTPHKWGPPRTQARLGTPTNPLIELGQPPRRTARSDGSQAAAANGDTHEFKDARTGTPANRETQDAVRMRQPLRHTANGNTHPGKPAPQHHTRTGARTGTPTNREAQDAVRMRQPLRHTACRGGPQAATAQDPDHVRHHEPQPAHRGQPSQPASPQRRTSPTVHKVLVSGRANTKHRS